MSTPAPLDPKVPSNDPSTEDPLLVPPFEERLRMWWEKNSRIIYTLVTVTAVVILAKGGWDYYQQKQEEAIEADYASSTTPEKLKSFISRNPTHPLAGVSALRLADEAYSSANYTEAQAQYQKAADILKTGPFAGRARLGLAVAQVAAGQGSQGEEKLKQLANDISALKPVRAEAAFHLATLAQEAGRLDDAAKYLDLAGTIDPDGVWAQRAMMVRANLQVPPAAAAAAPAGTP